jgi:hypothetical protein
MFEDDRLDVIVGVNINAAHQLYQLARFRLIVAAGFIDRFADKVEGHF